MDITTNIPQAYTAFKTQADTAPQLPVKAAQTAPATTQFPQPREATEFGNKEAAAIAEPEELRMEAIRKAVNAYKALFPISQTRFTIYKGVGGEFFTRFTNMVDGSVRTIPEPELMDFLAKQQGMDSISTVSTQA